MEIFFFSVLGKNQFMKKIIFIAVALITGSVAVAQQKKEKQPPPPPPPPVVNVKEVPPPPEPVEPPPPPEVKMEEPKDFIAFLKRNPTVKGIDWNKNKVHIRSKSGKEEVYDLNKEDEVQKLKDKYGELPTPPPPPPPPPAEIPKNIIGS